MYLPQDCMVCIQKCALPLCFSLVVTAPDGVGAEGRDTKEELDTHRAQGLMPFSLEAIYSPMCKPACFLCVLP
jgi:hypothetical protein